MKILDLSIVIPTLNEEEYIGQLLDSIATQSNMPREIVVVDAKSKDKTEKEARRRQKKLPQLRFYNSPQGVSKQRNFGAKKTTSPHLLFLDADTMLLHNKTLEMYNKELTEKKPDIASAFNYPLSDHWKDIYYFRAMNILFRSAKPVWPMTLGTNFYIKRELFIKVGGFDENIRTGEDMELMQRVIRKGGEFRFLRKPKVYTSVRRLEKEGHVKFTLKMAKSFYYVVTSGYQNNPVEYEFGNFQKD